MSRLYETSGGAAGATWFLYDGDELVADLMSQNLKKYCALSVFQETLDKSRNYEITVTAEFL